jgi:hypothetical protein
VLKEFSLLFARSERKTSKLKEKFDEKLFFFYLSLIVGVEMKNYRKKEKSVCVLLERKVEEKFLKK